MGTIYLTIQTFLVLPEIALKNIVLVSILSGQNASQLTLDSYLAPLKDELLSAWNNGIEITVDTTEGLKHHTLYTWH